MIVEANKYSFSIESNQPTSILSTAVVLSPLTLKLFAKELLSEKLYGAGLFIR